MKNTFIDQLFFTFSINDWKQLRKFVASPYFNGRQQLIRLLEYFIGCYQKNEPPEKKAGFSYTFPEREFEDQLWRLSVSQLYKLAEQWLAFRKIQQTITFPALPLAMQYRRHGFPEHHERTIRQFEKSLNKAPRHDAEFFEDKYQLEWEKYQFRSSGKRTEEFNLQEVTDAMDIAFIARKLRVACFAVSHEAVYKTRYDLGLLQAVIEKVAHTPLLLESPPIALYYHCYLALTNNDEFHFQTLIESLAKFAEVLPVKELRNLYLLAINFGIRQINASRPAYDRPVLDLYKIGLEKKLLLNANHLSHFTFNNIVAIAIRIGENAWVETFMNQYKMHLERRHRKVSYALGMARLSHAKKAYKTALLFLQNADYKDFINNIIAKTLQMKIYYETGELEVLEAHLRNMKSYIMRKRTMGYHRSNYLSIIRFTQAMMDLNPFDRHAKKSLFDEIDAEDNLTEKEWLLNMLNR